MSRWTEFVETPATGFRLGMFLKWPDANVGALLGTRAGVDTAGQPVVLVALDFDAEDEGALDTLLRNTPNSPMVKVGRRGETRFFRAPASLKSASFDGPDGRLLDLLCAGRQTVVPPSVHPETMVYRWTSGPCAIDQLPVLTSDNLDQIYEALETCGWKLDAAATSVEPRAPRDFDASDPFDRAKAAAMADLNAWVPHLPHLYGLRPARDGFEAVDGTRESSSGRALNQRARNLSIQRGAGIKDFGSGWTGSAIDLVARLCEIDTSEALTWLEDRLGLGDDGSVVIALARAVDNETDLPGPLRGLAPTSAKPVAPSISQTAAAELRAEEVSPLLSQTRARVVRDIDFDAWRSSRLVGEPPEIQWLIRDAIPLAIPAMVAAQGDAGKSMMLLDAARRVAFGASPLEGPCFGGMVEREGTAVILTAEDDAGSIHRRIANLDPDNARFSAGGERLIVVPLPDAGGPLPLVRDGRHGLEATDEYKRLADKLAAIDDLAMVVFDPLQAFVHAPINEDPAAGQFTCSLLATLAARTQAAVIVAHHTRKPTGDQKKGIKTLQEAREMVRGTTALVDGLRLVYALWAEGDGEARKVCERLGLEYEANRVIRGGVVKANGPVRRRISTFVRNATGLLIDQTLMLSEAPSERQEQMAALASAVATAAKVGVPYTRTGQTGFEANKQRLPPVLHALGRDKLLTVAEDALQRGIIVACTAKGSPAAKWLDVPGGPISEGYGEFALGKARDQKAAA